MLTLLATASDEGGFTFPEDPGAQAIWAILAVVILGAYIMISRTRRRAREDYIRHKMWEKELRENDPDMRKDDD